MKQNQYKFRSIFEATASMYDPDKNQKKLAIASLKNLSNIFDEEIAEKIDKNPDLLFITSPLILLDSVNLNDDGIFAEDILPVSEQFENKFLNKEHNRDDGAIGAISHISFASSGENIKIKKEDVLKYTQGGTPIQLVIGGYVWRLIDKEMCDLIEESSALDNKKISVSFELLFNSYDIAICEGANRSLLKARIITEEDSEWDKFNSMLRMNGGSGLYNGNIVGRVLRPTILPAGAGIVATPASGIKGILAVNSNDLKEIEDEEEDDSEDENENEDSENETESEIIKNRDQEDKEEMNKISESNINKKNSSVIQNKPVITMPIKSIDDLNEQLFKNEAVANEVRDFIKTKYIDHAEKFAIERAELEQQAKAAMEAKEKTEALAAELNEKLATLQGELEKVRAAHAASEAEAAFNTRLAEIDKIFEFEDDEREYIVAELRAIDSDESFAKYMEKNKKLMKEKTKMYKAEMKCKNEKATKASVSTVDAKAVIASASENADQEISKSIPGDTDIGAQILEAFRDKVTVGGKKLKK